MRALRACSLACAAHCLQSCAACRTTAVVLLLPLTRQHAPKAVHVLRMRMCMRRRPCKLLLPLMLHPSRQVKGHDERRAAHHVVARQDTVEDYQVSFLSRVQQPQTGS